MAKITLPDFSGLRIAVIGDAIKDVYVRGRIERISPEAPVPVFLEDGPRYETAGGAANVAANVRALGAGAELIAKRKDQWSIKTRFICNGQQVFRADNDHLELSGYTADGIRGMLHGFQFVIVSDYAKGMITSEVMDGVRASGLPFIVDPKASDWTKYQGCQVITPNESEFQAWGGRNSLMKWPVILVTKGERGMWVSGYGGIDVSIPAASHEVADVTGAGDTVIATLGCCLAAGMDLVDAAKTANAAAGVVVQKRGTAVCTRQELEAVLAHHH